MASREASSILELGQEQAENTPEDGEKDDGEHDEAIASDALFVPKGGQALNIASSEIGHELGVVGLSGREVAG